LNSKQIAKRQKGRKGSTETDQNGENVKVDGGYFSQQMPGGDESVQYGKYVPVLESHGSQGKIS